VAPKQTPARERRDFIGLEDSELPSLMTLLAELKLGGRQILYFGITLRGVYDLPV
jgi:hypothetical protein